MPLPIVCRCMSYMGLYNSAVLAACSHSRRRKVTTCHTGASVQPVQNKDAVICLRSVSGDRPRPWKPGAWWEIERQPTTGSGDAQLAAHQAALLRPRHSLRSRIHARKSNIFAIVFRAPPLLARPSMHVAAAL